MSDSIAPTPTLSKRLRFEIFKRDSFTCQYCGAQPPSVVLEVDHVHPKSRGGDNDPGNLITSCLACNRGKSDKPLGERIIRPDADLLYLEAMQEAAEYERYIKAKKKRDKALMSVIESIQDDFQRMSGTDWVPDDSIVLSMLARNTPEQVSEAASCTGNAIRNGRFGEHTVGAGWLPYMRGILKHMREGDVE